MARYGAYRGGYRFAYNQKFAGDQRALQGSVPARLGRVPVPAENARDVVDFCFEAVRRFVGNAEQADDITVLAIRRGADLAGKQ